MRVFYHQMIEVHYLPERIMFKSPTLLLQELNEEIHVNRLQIFGAKWNEFWYSFKKIITTFQVKNNLV